MNISAKTYKALKKVGYSPKAGCNECGRSDDDEIFAAVKWLWEKYEVWVSLEFVWPEKRFAVSFITTAKHTLPTYDTPDEAYNSGLEAALGWIKENR